MQLFDSTNELWTEFMASGGLVGVMADATAGGAVSSGDQDKLHAIENFAGTNSYIRARHMHFIVYMVKKVLNAEPSTTD